MAGLEPLTEMLYTAPPLELVAERLAKLQQV